VPAVDVTEEHQMRQYLLSVYQPGGPIPAPEVLEKISRELDVLNQNLKAAGVWVFAGGCTRRVRPP
jgi:hypothetical protein